MSDKTMHILAYFVLTFLVWFAVSPYQKMQWKRFKVWIVLMTVIGYAAIDEYLQGYVGRSVDIRDFIADVFGVILTLGILSVVDFWPAILISSAIFMFVISNYSNLLQLQDYWDAAFHFTAYTAFTVIWIQYLDRRNWLSENLAIRLIQSLTGPALLLFAIKMNALMLGRPFDGGNVIIGLFGICGAIMFSALILRVAAEKRKPRFDIYHWLS